MNIFLQFGTSIVIFALISYSVAIITEQRTAVISKRVLWFLTLGISLDLVATSLMIIGSSHGPFTLHGFIGYSSLLAMLIDAFFIWREKRRNGIGAVVPKWLHQYSRYAYLWWVAAFITGALLVIFKK